MIGAIRKQIDVPCRPEKAFAILTGQIASWWPLDGHSVSAMNGRTAKSVVLEPKVGGKIYEVGSDGEIICWGTVRAFDPGARLVLAWHIQKPESDATEVEFTISELPGGRSRVVLEHRGWDKRGDDGVAQRDSYNRGWVHVFETCYRDACAN